MQNVIAKITECQLMQMNNDGLVLGISAVIWLVRNDSAERREPARRLLHGNDPMMANCCGDKRQAGADIGMNDHGALTGSVIIIRTALTIISDISSVDA